MGTTVIVEYHDIVGMVGVALILLMYLAVQTGRAKGGGLGYSLVNLAGALMILYSLFFKFNLSAVIIETCWVVISILGLLRWWRLRGETRAARKRGESETQE